MIWVALNTYSTSAQNKNRKNMNHLEICLSSSQKVGTHLLGFCQSCQCVLPYVGVKAILQEELGLQEKAGDERRPGYQARVKKREGREESDLRKTGKRRS